MKANWNKIIIRLAGLNDQGTMALGEAGKHLLEGSAVGRFTEIDASDNLRLPLLFALAKGDEGGTPARVATTIRSIPHGMGRATGIPLTLGTRLHLGRVATKG